MDLENESRLICAVQNGQLDAYEELIHAHGGRLRAFIAMKLPVSHLIDEIAHETFVFAYKRIQDFEVGTDFGKWLRAIAYNLVRQETLRYQRSGVNQDRYLEHCAMMKVGHDEVKPVSAVVAFLEECVSCLPEGQQELLQRRYRRSESTREMAVGLGKSEAWVRTTLFRLRAALKDCIEQKLSVDRGEGASRAALNVLEPLKLKF